MAPRHANPREDNAPHAPRPEGRQHLQQAYPVRSPEASIREAHAPQVEATEDQGATELRADRRGPTPGSPATAVVEKKAPPARGSGWKKKVGIAAGSLALLAAGWYGYDYITVGRYMVSTDDAYVGADMSMVSAKISANVAGVRVESNQTVKAGDVLVELDPGDFRLAVEQAAAKVATQQSTVATFDAQINSARAAAAQARAQLVAANATVERAEADFDRINTLAQKSYSPKATLDAARATRDSARAQATAQTAAIQSADANIAVLQAQKVQAERTLKEYEVTLDKAKRDLSFTTIRAPFDGVVGNKSVQVGDYVTPGKRLAAIVPLDKVFIDANLKETQLAGVKVGEKASVKVDALGGAVIEGTVRSIAPASGSQFSLLPPENATGNFTKIVQRVPVRVEIDAKDAAGHLRPGLSVVVSIDTRTAPKAQVSAVPITRR